MWLVASAKRSIFWFAAFFTPRRMLLHNNLAICSDHVSGNMRKQTVLWLHKLRDYGLTLLEAQTAYTFPQRKETTGHSPVLQVAGHGPVLPLASSPCAHAKKLRLIQHYCARFWQALLCKILARTGHGPVLSTGHGPVL